MSEDVFRLEPPSTLWVGPIPYRWAQIVRQTHISWPAHECAFARLHCENGWVVIVRWCSESWSSNVRHGKSPAVEFQEQPALVEVIIVNRFGEPALCGHPILEFADVRTVHEVIAKVANWPSSVVASRPDVGAQDAEHPGEDGAQ